MIDHVSIPVRDLARSAALYERLLAHLELTRLVNRPATVGFGKRYPEFWLNLRSNLVTARAKIPERTSACARRARPPSASSSMTRWRSAAPVPAIRGRDRRR